MEPKEKDTKEWYAWTLRHTYYYSPVFLMSAIKNGLDLATLREYLSCLKNNELGEQPSLLLQEKSHFNTISIWIAYKNGTGVIDILRKYINCLEDELKNQEDEP